MLSPLSCQDLTPSQRCKSLVHIGDSTSVGIVNQLKNNYQSHGFHNVYISAGNGRSIAYATKPDTLNGVDAIKFYKNKLGSGTCWVIALGTNDAASVYKPNDSFRINSVMKAVNGDPVLWVNVWMNSKTRPEYNKQAAVTWNNLLSSITKNYPNSTILDWASFVKKNPSWLSVDGYHYSSIGSLNRSQIIPATAAFFMP